MSSQLLKYALLVSIATGLSAYSAAADDELKTSTTSTVEKADHKTTSFIKDAARDNELELALTEIGNRKAQNPELKSFIQDMQQDHTLAKQQLQPLAQKYGVALDETALKEKAQKAAGKLENEFGAEFDKKFSELALKLHQKDIEKYHDAANNLQTPDVRQYAQDMLPKLRQHFQHATTVASAVGVDQATITSYTKKLPPAVGGSELDDQGMRSKPHDASKETGQGAGARDQTTPRYP
jgi:putative membrane protein